MWIRTRLDIRWRDLFFALVGCVRPASRISTSQAVSRIWADDRNVLVTLSVRSSFDLLLRTLKLPRNSEVMFTALTVPGMVDIARHHGLRAVPVDLTDDGQIDPDSLRAAITDQTSVFVVAHLWGGRVDLGPVKTMLREHGVLIVEDCAQSLSAVGDGLDSDGDVVMHSFGPIKTATALGGGIVEVRDQHLFAEMKSHLESDPVQSRYRFTKRVLRFTLIRWLTVPGVAKVMFAVFKRFGIDPDQVLGKVARGFAAKDLIPQIRQQPTTPLLLLLRRRLRTYDFTRLNVRANRGQQIDHALGLQHAPENTFWAYPLVTRRREQLVVALRAQGFDATWVTRIAIVPAVGERRATNAEALWAKTVFLPCYPELPETAVQTMTAEINSIVGNEMQMQREDHHLEFCRS